MKEFIDSTMFLGMHSKDEKTRIACKNFFVRKLGERKKILMSLEQVGKCDDVIWNFSRKKQDAYYPFMDNLHTTMRIERITYSESDITKAFNENILDLDILKRLTIGMVISRRGILYTLDSSLLSKRKIPVTKIEFSKEISFPKNLEKLYQKSLELRICIEE